MKRERKMDGNKGKTSAERLSGADVLVKTLEAPGIGATLPDPSEVDCATND
jgi:hypothetical protein